MQPVIVKIAIIVACLCVAVDSGSRLLSQLHHRDVSAARSASHASTPEEQIYNNSGLDYSASERTVLLFVDSSCGYCSRSMPFYRRLIEAAERRASREIRIVAVATQPRNVLRSYLESNGVRLDRLISLGPDVVQVQRTPTLIVVNAQGRMERSWVGLLSKDEQDAVMALIERGI